MHGALAAAGQCPQAKWLSNLGASRRRSIWPLGAVLETDEFFEESKPEQRGVALKPRITAIISQKP
jgi:hypothetical protein